MFTRDHLGMSAPESEPLVPIAEDARSGMRSR
jgi:hypothetical protein